MADMDTRRGKPAKYDFEIVGEKDAPLSYADDAVLTGTLYAGDDTAPLATLTPVWLDAATGLAQVTIPGAVTEGLEPSVYQVLIEVDALDGQGPVPARDLSLRVYAAPGTAPPPAAYGSAEDLASIVPWIGQALAEGEDQAGFAEQRGLARDDMDRCALARYEDRCWESVSLGWRGATWPVGEVLDLLAETEPAAPWVDAQVTALQVALDADRLVIDTTGRRIAANLALGHVLIHQIGQSPDGTSFQSLGWEFRSRGHRMMAAWKFRLTPLVPGDPIIRIG